MSTRHPEASKHQSERPSTRGATERSAPLQAEISSILFDQLPVAVYQLEATPPYDVLFIKGALEAITGYKPEEWLSLEQPWKACIHEEDQPRCLRKLLFALASGLPQEWQHRYIHRNGNTVWVKHRLQAITPSESDAPITLVGNIQNITAERLTMGQNFQAKSAPAPSQSQGLSRLAGGIAHEFNNALTAVLGNAQLLLREFDEKDGKRRSLLEIISSGERAADLTQQLLSFSRTNKHPAQFFDLNEFLQHMEPLIQEHLHEEQTLKLDLSSAPVPIKGHRDMLESMLMQLAENSRDAMTEEGVLTLQTRCVLPNSTGPWPKDAPHDQPLIHLQVSDTGSGIPEKDQPYIFDPFYSTHEDPQYRGLGLSLALHAIELHNGSIEVRSEKSRGTTMDIYIPWHGKQEETQTSSPQKAPHGKETLLLVEDDTMVRETTERILKSLDYTVVSARDAADAIDIMRQDTVHVDMVLLDIFMPDMDGFTLSQHLKDIRPDLQCMFISGFAQEPFGEGDTTALDGTNFISKPYTRDKLAMALRKVLDESSE